MALEMQTTLSPVSAINIRGINYNFHSIRLRQSRPLDWKLLNSLTTTDPQRDAVLTPETQRSGASFGIRVRKPESGVGSRESRVSGYKLQSQDIRTLATPPARMSQPPSWRSAAQTSEHIIVN